MEFRSNIFTTLSSQKVLRGSLFESIILHTKICIDLGKYLNGQVSYKSINDEVQSMPELKAGLSHGDKCGASWMAPIAGGSIAWRAGVSTRQNGTGT